MKILKLIWATIFGIFLASSIYAQNYLTNGLVAYYPFNGNANDMSGNGYNPLNVQATLCADRFGNASSSYFFNGVDNYIGFSVLPLTQTQNWTLAAWIQPASLNQLGYVMSMGWDNGADGNGYAMCIHNGSGSGAGGTLGGVFGGQGFFGSGYSFPTNSQWYHVVMTESSGITTFYVNGISAPVTHSGVPKIPTNFTIGSATGVRFFNGAIDEVRIYNRALTASEVNQLYAFSGAPPSLPHAALGIPTLINGFVVCVNLTDSGYGYTNVPLVRFFGGGAVKSAQGFATVNNGVLTSITITDAGYGYTNPPVLVIDPPIFPRPNLEISPMSYLLFTNLTVGGQYQLQQLTGYYWSNIPLIFIATNSSYSELVSGVVNSGTYRLALNPVPAQAFATAQIINGFVVGATINNGGSGYIINPAIKIVGKGGTNATAVSSISGGVVIGITITGAGINYTNGATIEIAPPPAASILCITEPVMRLDSSNLAPYENYQVQFKADLSGNWGNWFGSLFMPTNTTDSEYIFTTNNLGFFRLQYFP